MFHERAEGKASDRHVACGRGAKDRPPPTNSAPQKQHGPLREYLALHDLTACLLEAYDCVTRRAHEKYIERGSSPGKEIDDWLAAQKELLPSLPTNVKESGDFVYALASVPGATVSEIAVGVESHFACWNYRRKSIPNNRSRFSPMECLRSA